MTEVAKDVVRSILQEDDLIFDILESPIDPDKNPRKGRYGEFVCEDDAIQLFVYEQPVDTEHKISPEVALELMEQGLTVMVLPYDEDYANFTGITIEDFEDESDEEILTYLREKDAIEFWD